MGLTVGGLLAYTAPIFSRGKFYRMKTGGSPWENGLTRESLSPLVTQQIRQIQFHRYNSSIYTAGYEDQAVEEHLIRF